MWHVAVAEPLVAVVIPLHNAEPWIAETLASIFASDGVAGESVELLVVDDGSQDAGARVAGQMLASSPFRSCILQHERVRGAAAARNTGWRAARAPWIQFLDADDLLAPHKLRLHLDAAGAYPDAAVLYSRWAHLVRPGAAWQVAEGRDPRLGTDPCSELLRSDIFLQMGSMLVARTALYKAGGFDASTSPVEDVDLLQCIALQGGQFVHVQTDEPTLLYRQVPGSLSRRDPRQFALGCLTKAETADDHFRATGEVTAERRARLIEAYFFCARALAPHDTAAFERAVSRIEHLQGAALPPGPPALRRLSKLMGYRRAERAAIYYRKWKQALARARRT